MSTRATLSVENRMHDDGSEGLGDKAEVLNRLSVTSLLKDSISARASEYWVRCGKKIAVLVMDERAQIVGGQKQQPCSGQSSDNKFDGLSNERCRVASKTTNIWPRWMLTVVVFVGIAVAGRSERVCGRRRCASLERQEAETGPRFTECGSESSLSLSTHQRLW